MSLELRGKPDWQELGLDAGDEARSRLPSTVRGRVDAWRTSSDVLLTSAPWMITSPPVTKRVGYCP